MQLAFTETPEDLAPMCFALDRLLPVWLENLTWTRPTLLGFGTRALRQEGLQLSGDVDFAPLLAALEAAGYERLVVTVVQPTSDGPIRMPAAGRSTDTWCTFEYSTHERPGRWHWVAGFPPRDVARIVWVLTALLLVPLMLLMAIRVAALDRKSDPSSAWFQHWRRSGWIVLLSWLAWPSAVVTLRVTRLAEWLVSDWLALFRAPFVAWTYLAVPALIAVAAAVIGHQVSVRARGVEWTLRETLTQALWQAASVLVPVALISFAFPLMDREDFRGALLAALGGIVAAVVFTQYHQRSVDLTPHALSTGALRDRIFELASLAKVKLGHIYVLPMRKARLANAFAVRGGTVLLTDVLLENLSRREMDAVMAHEIVHLRLGHPFQLSFAFALIGATGFVAYSVGLGQRLPMPWMAAALLLSLVLLFALFRRFERAADAGAVQLTGDPEGLIRALARLGRLNRIPHEWGKWSGAFITHPSTGWRVRAIGRAAGLSETNVAELLQDDRAAADRYDVPTTLGAGKEFSTSFKLGTVTRNAWLLVGIAVITPTLCVILGRASGLARHSGLAGALAGAAFTLGLMMLAFDFVTVRPYRTLRRRLRERMEREGVNAEPLGGVFVGFAPGPEPRVYEHFFDWDVGYLFLSRDRLIYLGEEARFALTPSQVKRIAIGPGAPGWIPSARIYLDWDASGRAGTFQLRPAEVPRLSRSREAAGRLNDILQAWQSGEGTMKDVPLPSFGPPQIGDVTSLSPRAVATLRTTVFGCLLMIVLGLAASTVTDLFAGGGLGVLYIIGVGCLGQLALQVPYWRYRSPQARRTPAAVSARRAA